MTSAGGIGRWASIMVLVGCAGGALPVTYALPELSVAARAGPVIDGVVMVERLRTDAVLAARALVRRRADTPHTLDQDGAHLWNDPPGRLVQDQLYACLANTRSVRTVTRPTEPVLADAILGGTLLKFGQRLAAEGSDQPARFELAVALTLADRQSRERQWAWRFDHAEPAADDSPPAAVTAAGRAVAALCAALTKALAGADLGRQR